MIINLVISNFKRSNDSPSSSMDTFKRATTRRRISSIRSSIPKASKTLFGKRWKRTVEQNATNCLRQVPLWLSKAFRILLFALVWYRYLFEIFHHFRYLKSKYPESIANHHPSVQFQPAPFSPFTFRTFRRSIEYYNENLLLYELYTRNSSIIFRSIIYLKFDNDSKNDTFCLKIQKESLSINFPSTNKKFCVLFKPG